MKYLMRAARRLSATGAPVAGAAKLRPAMPSRSPLAEADQRLNIDSFAELFDVPVVRERNDAAAENEPVVPSASDRSGSLASERSPSPMGEPRIASEPTIPAVPSASESESAPARAKPAGATPRQVSPLSAARPTRPRTQTASDSGTPSVPEKPIPSPDRRAAGPPSRRVNSLPDLAAAEGSRPVPGSSRREPAQAAREQAPQRERADPVMDAVSRAMRWVEGRSRNSREEERGDHRKDSSSQRPQPRLGEMVEARPLRPTLRDVRPITHLEIGKIEVEVVAPVKSAQSRPRPSAQSEGGRFSQRFSDRLSDGGNVSPCP